MQLEISRGQKSTARNLRLYHSRTLVSLLCLVPSESFTSAPSSIYSLDRLHGSKKGGIFEIRGRGFHLGTRSLGFRASDAVRAGFAMGERYFEEEKVVSSKKGGDDEGLEIAKLGIDQSIVGELTKRGITKLFPIRMMMKLMQQINANLKCHISIRSLSTGSASLCSSSSSRR